MTSRMRSVSMLLLAIMLSCSSTLAQVNIFGINMTTPVPLISNSNIDMSGPPISRPNMDMPKPIISYPNMDMPKINPAIKNSNQAINLTSNNSSRKAQTKQLQQKVKPIDVTGKWSIKLINNTSLAMDLNLWSPNGIKIMGFGTLAEGSTKYSITASGSVGTKELTLTARSAVPDYDKEYDLHLLMINDTLSGNYDLKSVGKYLGKGNATAIKQ